MTNTKHTPAPWTISGNTLLHVTSAPANVQVATIGECRPSDARLIAAAPELLAAAIRVLNAVTPADNWSGFHSDGDRYDDTPEYIIELRAAISKAEGK